MKYIIGIDGGGTKTEAVAYDLEGNELYKVQGGAGNLSSDAGSALSNILDTINKCRDELKGDECVFIALGLAGVESGNNKEIVYQALKKEFNTEIKVMNDADIALAALLKGEDGILTIAGTGSICYGIHNNKSARAGGWGHLIGDEGSGYYIAMEAIKNMASREDDLMPLDNLSNNVLQALSLKSPQQIKGFVYSKGKAEIASLATVVVKTAESGDKASINILKNAGRDLARISLQVCNKLNLKSNVKIGIIGSVLNKCTIVKSSFEKELTKSLDGFKIIHGNTSPTLGGYYLYKPKNVEK